MVSRRSARRRVVRSVAVAVASALTAVHPSQAATATYVGPNDGLWSVAANWSGGVVPNNASFDVAVPSGLRVRYDLTAATTIGSLSNSGGVRLVAGTANLTVANGVNGLVEIQQGAFASTTTNPLNVAQLRLYATGGGVASVASPSYAADYLNYVGALDVFVAEGTNSTLNLSGLRNVALADTGGGNAYVVRAGVGGTVNLSGLLTVTATTSDDSLDFVLNAGGAINLNALAGASQARFFTNAGTQALPALTTAAGTAFNVGASATVNAPVLAQLVNGTLAVGVGGTFAAPNLTNVTGTFLTYDANRTITTGTLANIDRARFLVQGGASNGTVTDTSYPADYLNYVGTRDTFVADGTGSVLNLSSLRSIDLADTGGGNSYAVRAINGGTVNLSGLLSVNATTSDDYVDVYATTNGTVNLAALNRAAQTRFFVNAGATQMLPALTQLVDNSSVTLDAGATFNAPNLTSVAGSTLTYSAGRTLTTGPLSNIDRARLFVSGGVVVNSVTDASYPANFLNYVGAQDVFSADGTGSALNLSSLRNIDVADTGGGNAYVVRASNGGTVNLSGLLAVNATTTDDYVDFVAGTGSTINLGALASASQARFFINTGATQALPALATTNGAAFVLGVNTTINLPVLAQLNNGSVSLDTGATFNAPNVTSVAGSYLIYDAGRTIMTGALANIDRTRFLVRGGAINNAVTDTSYPADYLNYVGARDAFVADGTGSVLNLSSLRSIDVGETGGGNAYSVRAVNGGTVNLSGLLAINATTTDDYVEIYTTTNGTVNLGALARAAQTRFFVNANATQNLPALVQLTSNGSVTLDPGATFNAPNLRSIAGSTLTYQSGRTIVTGTLSDIDHARLFVKAGATNGTVSDTSYPADFLNYVGAQDVFGADGTGATLNLASVNNIAIADTGGGNAYVIRAANAGAVNLSGLLAVTATTTDDFVDVYASAAGSVDLSGLRSIAQCRFYAGSGGLIKLGDVATATNCTFQTTDANGKFTFSGGLVLDAASTLSLAPLSVVEIPGRLGFATTDETKFRADTAEVRITGSDVQRLEVGGVDSGAANPGNNGNFGFGQLRIGTTTQSSVVELVDVYDNGNRGGTGGKETLYAYGLGGGPAGLVMQSGSLFAIGGFNVYVNQNGTLVNLQSIFPTGGNVVPYTFNGSNGFILRGLTLSPRFYDSPDTGGRVYYDGPNNGGWDPDVNWSTDVRPSAAQDAYITPASGLNVSGPLADATVRNLVVDATSGTTVLSFNALGVTTRVVGGLQVGTGGVVNLVTGTLDVGTTLSIGTVVTALNTTYRTDSILNQGAMTLRGTTVAGATVNNVSLTLAGGTHAFGPITGPGDTAVGASALATVDRVRQNALAITNNGRVVVRPRDGAEYEVSRVNTLTMDAAGRLDLADNPLILDGGTIGSIEQLARTAYAGGAWTGPGISSSLAGGATRTGVGYSTASVAGVGAFFGEAVDPTDLLVRLTLLGDVNLDGTVGFDDLLRVAQNYGVVNNRSWYSGDFTYDGGVTFNDLLALAQNYGVALLADGSLRTDAALHARFAADWAVAQSLVPEPTIAAAGVLLVAAIRRRRRF